MVGITLNNHTSKITLTSTLEMHCVCACMLTVCECVVGGHALKNLFFCLGHGKTHKDAASVRATHPIPAACGLYYFEVKIVSKGRDGYMGIGLSAQGVNMNRLPGNNIHTHSVF